MNWAACGSVTPEFSLRRSTAAIHSTLLSPDSPASGRALGPKKLSELLEFGGATFWPPDTKMWLPVTAVVVAGGSVGVTIRSPLAATMRLVSKGYGCLPSFGLLRNGDSTLPLLISRLVARNAVVSVGVKDPALGAEDASKARPGTVSSTRITCAVLTKLPSGAGQVMPNICVVTPR